MLLLQLITLLDFKNGGYFGHLYEKHRAVVYGYVYEKIGNHHDTEEIVTDTFFEVWRSIDRFRGMDERDEKSLIIVYARNNTVDFYRKKKTRVATVPLQTENVNGEEAQIEIPDETQNPEAIYEDKQACALLKKRIARLSEEQQEVLRMKYRMGMSNKDIAEILKISIESVNSRVYRAKRTLEKEVYGGWA